MLTLLNAGIGNLGQAQSNSSTTQAMTKMLLPLLVGDLIRSRHFRSAGLALFA
jgi:hypothetical protein